MNIRIFLMVGILLSAQGAKGAAAAGAAQEVPGFDADELAVLADRFWGGC